MSTAEAYDVTVTRRPLVPPSPPRAPDTMTAIGRMAAMRVSPIGTWGQRAYEEDIIQGRFFGRSSFILNTPDAIRHVLVDNYENYSRTPAGLRMLRPILGEGLLIAEGRAWKHQRRTLAPAFTPRASVGTPGLTSVGSLPSSSTMSRGRPRYPRGRVIRTTLPAPASAGPKARAARRCTISEERGNGER